MVKCKKKRKGCGRGEETQQRRIKENKCRR
jgi:hypothetical protein